MILNGILYSTLQAVPPKSASRYFSPNLDGNKDSILIPLIIKDEFLEKWKISIYEKKGKNYRLIRVFDSINVKEIPNLTSKKFIKRIFEKKSPVSIPQNIEWDGYTRIPKDKKREKFKSSKAKDGLYYYRITAIDEAGNTSRSSLVPIYLDTITPVAKLNNLETIFSPNGDGNKDILLFEFDLDDFQMSSDSLTITFFSENGLPIFKSNFNQLANRNRLEFNFDGLYQGKEIPEGNHLVTFKTKDFAGNEKTYPTIPVKLIRTIEQITLTSSHPAFAPNNNGYFDSLTFNLSASSQIDLLTWNLKILQEENLIYDFTGEKYLPETLIYEGQNKKGKTITDGEYQAILTLQYLSGNAPASEKISFIIDKTPPKLNVSVENQDNVFLPRAKENNSLKIKQLAIDREPKNYVGIISGKNGNHVYYREFGNSLPETLNWDGKNENGVLVTGSYIYTLLAEDSLGNKSQVSSKPFKVIDELANIFVDINFPAFSPNGDGEKEKVKIRVTMDKNNQERVKMQKLTIYLEKKTIYETTSSHFQPEYEWNGKNNGGEKVVDEKYEIRVKTQLTGGETAKASPVFVYLDTKPIEVTLKVSEKIFSPNEDGRKDFIVISQLKKKSSLGDSKDKMASLLIDDKGVIHRKNTWVENLPKSLKWKGTDQKKKLAPEGIYTYVLKTTDHAGNKKSFKTKPFKLIREIEEVHLKLNTNIYSHKIKKPVSFTPIFSSLEDFNSFSLVSVNSKGEKRILAIKTNVQVVHFKGLDKDKKKLEDDHYLLYIQSIYENGNLPASSNVFFQIDSRGPKVNIFSKPKFFSPDGDGIDDELYLKIEVTDESSVSDSSVFIYRLKEFDKRNKVFKQTLQNYQQNEKLIKFWNLGNNTSQFLKWNGKDKNNRLSVESANDYQVFVSSTDAAGNTNVKQKTITVDILVEKIGEGRYRIIINSINFKFDSDKMIGNYQKTLNRLVSILSKFNQYQFKITGHTDTTGKIAYNQNLSIKRARAVYDYLVAKNMKKDRMTIEGKGELEPLISPEKNEEDQRKNRRVEFYLIKDEQ